MQRDKMLRALHETEMWDLIVIGGGATGLGIAVDAASRGFAVLLLERGDFAQATSSRSTKLIHGGLRYLQQGNIGLVFEALHERGALLKNAPHLIAQRPFLVPNYRWWESPFYRLGLKVYDLLAGRLGFHPSYAVSRDETLDAMPTIESYQLKGATIYYDGQFDDARLAITLARTAADLGAILLNYAPVTGLVKEHGKIVGVTCLDTLAHKTYTLKAKAVINATGIFSDETRELDEENPVPHMVHSQGIHLVLPKTFLPGDTALLIPHTEDKRILFVVPWHERILIGTTDTLKDKPEMEPEPLEKEIDFLLETAGNYLSLAPERSDILSVFTGIRPLVKEGHHASTKKIARNHKIFISDSNFITIAGGKWTTYRKMAEDVIDAAIQRKLLPTRVSRTLNLRLHGYAEGLDPTAFQSSYGTNISELHEILEEDPFYAQKIDAHLPYLFGEVIYACRFEMAQHLEDVLSRRTRSLLLDAKAAKRAAPEVARLMAKECRKDAMWIKAELAAFNAIATHYLVPS